MSTKTLHTLDFSILQQCMHCGMCLPTCPTYQETKLEMHSPRGRIALMRAIAEDRLELTETFHEEMNYCLGCLACETACPAGVDYNQLLEVSRFEAEKKVATKKPFRSLIRKGLLGVLFSRQWLLRLVGRGLWIYQKLKLQEMVRKSGVLNLLPKLLKEWEKKTPTVQVPFSCDRMAVLEKPKTPSRYKVGMLTGCVQDILFADVNRDTVDVLLHNGCEVYTPPTQGCCGSLQIHNGEAKWSEYLASRLIQEFENQSLDAIITNSAGCGSHLKNLHSLFEKESESYVKAKAFSSKVKDIHEWLVEIGYKEPDLSKENQTKFTYHDACHLCHGQKITQQPRELLKSIQDHEYCELKDSQVCCGSAGIYNLIQPETAGIMGAHKLENIFKTGAQVVVTSNPGCMMHLKSLSQESQVKLEWKHSVSMLAEAYRRSS